MKASLSAAQLQTLIAFAEDERVSVDRASLDALSGLYFAVQRNLAKNYEGAMRRNASLTERLTAIRERNTERADNGEYEESLRDSAEFARALLYQLQQRNTWKLTEYKVIAILYEMYASWLYSKRQRLFAEHPVATQYGPRFWHALKKTKVAETITHEEWKAFAAKDPAVAAFTIRAAEKYYDIKESSLTSAFMASKAFKNALPEHNNGKWNKEIDDKDIYAWKKSSDKSRTK